MKRNTGFTLLEVMFASGIMLAAGALMFSLSFNVRNFEMEEQRQNEVEREMTLVLDYIVRDIKSAADIAPDFFGDLGNPFLVLNVPRFNESGVSASGQFDYIVYDYSFQKRAVIRSIYDATGEAPVLTDRKVIQTGSSYFEAWVNGVPWWSLTGMERATTIDIYAARYESRTGYFRNFTVSATLRNPAW